MLKPKSRVNYLAQNRLKSQLKETNSKEKLRTCLKCAKEFKSTGPGNRLCSKCQAVNKTIRHSRTISLIQGGTSRKSNKAEGQ